MTHAPAAPLVEIGPGHPLLEGRSGRGVSVAVIDSGIHAGHPHVGGLAGAVAISDEGKLHGDIVDRLGHGTAVAAAIHEKAPDAEIYVVKIFHETLATNVEALVMALDWAADEGIRLLNLSLGTANPENAAALAEAADRVRQRGSLLLSASSHAGRVWYPGSLPGVIGVTLDAACPRECIRVSGGGGVRIGASSFARPIPGVPPERNINGVSFSVANATGIVARLLEDRPDVTTVERLAAVLQPSG